MPAGSPPRPAAAGLEFRRPSRPGGLLDSQPAGRPRSGTGGRSRAWRRLRSRKLVVPVPVRPGHTLTGDEERDRRALREPEPDRRLVAVPVGRARIDRRRRRPQADHRGLGLVRLEAVRDLPPGGLAGARRELPEEADDVVMVSSDDSSPSSRRATSSRCRSAGGASGPRPSDGSRAWPRPSCRRSSRSRQRRARPGAGRSGPARGRSCTARSTASTAPRLSSRGTEA